MGGTDGSDRTRHEDILNLQEAWLINKLCQAQITDILLMAKHLCEEAVKLSHQDKFEDAYLKVYQRA